MSWRDDDNALNGILGRAFSGEASFPETCPACAASPPSVHVYFNYHATSFGRRRGGCWVWCNSCRRYSHGSAFIPDFWKNMPGIDLKDLMHEPGVLEAKSDEIDRHWSKLLGT